MILKPAVIASGDHCSQVNRLALAIKITDMHSAQAKTVRPEIAVTETKTLAESPATKVVTIDHQSVTATFLTAGPTAERHAVVEEDSTDIFTLERCSPLNDF